MIPALFGSNESAVSSTGVSTEKQDGTSKGLVGRQVEEDVQALNHPHGGRAMLCSGLTSVFSPRAVIPMPTWETWGQNWSCSAQL